MTFTVDRPSALRAAAFLYSAWNTSSTAVTRLGLGPAVEACRTYERAVSKLTGLSTMPPESIEITEPGMGELPR